MFMAFGHLGVWVAKAATVLSVYLLTPTASAPEVH